MSAIQSSVGLITGIPIQDTVDQLIAVSARPRDQLLARTQGVQSEQAAIDTLSALVLGLRSSLSSLDRGSTFAGRTATSSDTEAVAVSVGANATPTPGSYQFTPLQAASSHQFVTGRVAGLEDSFGSGTLRLGYGRAVDAGVSLSELNGGSGFQPGRVRITDRSGDTATIDLRAAQTVDDVLRAINEADGVGVTASVTGDAFVLTDSSGGSGALTVDEVSGGTTASTLGLTTTAAGDTLTGADVYGLASTTRLATLNDGLGVELDGIEGLDDLTFTVADETADLGVDLGDAKTLGDIVDAINNDAEVGEKVSAKISADGLRLELTDKTSGGGAFTVASGATSRAAEDLGLTGAASGGVITGDRLAAGLGDTLLSSLNGGAGVAAGSIAVTDRNSATPTVVDLSSAETLGDVVDLINAAVPTIEASVNDSGTGLLIEDNSNGTGSLVIAESGGTTAADLGLLVDAQVASLDTGSLDRQSVGRLTSLSSLRGGEGISLGRIEITDSRGASSTVDLRFNGDDDPTLGDVIDEINKAGVSVTAGLNATGDGLVLTDTAGGTETLAVAEVDGGSTASDLRLAGVSTTTDDSGQQTIDGAATLEIDLATLGSTGADTPLELLNDGSGVDRTLFRITDSSGATAVVDLGDAATLQDVIDEINASSVSVTAALDSDGTKLELTDTAGGAETLAVEDLGSGRAAADLGIAGESTTDNSDDQQTITGDTVITTGGPLDLLASRINDADAGYTASVVFDGLGYRLSIGSSRAGADSALLLEGSTTDLTFRETSRAADAVGLVGPNPESGFAVVAPDGEFDGVVPGLDIDVAQATGETVTLDVAVDDSPVIDAVNGFISAYNAIRDNLEASASFDAEALTTGILFGRSEVVRVENDLGRIASGRLVSGSKYASLESVGVSLDQDGRLQLDQSKLTDALADDRDAVEDLFTDPDNGAVARFTEATDQLAGADNSLLGSRSDALGRTIESNNARIADLDERLGIERERLLLQFIRLEETIALLQSNLDTLSSVQPITIANSSNSTSN